MKTMDNRIQVDEDTVKHFIPDDELRQLANRFQERLKRIHAREAAEAAANAALPSGV